MKVVILAGGLGTRLSEKTNLEYNKQFSVEDNNGFQLK